MLYKKNNLSLIVALFCLAGFAMSMTVLYLAMRAVMDVGGFCAEGGPYQIEVHCPAGTAFLTPLSIFGMFIFGFAYMMNVPAGAFNFTYLFWSTLFGTLGWNFMDYGIFRSGEIEIGWLICGIVFWLMAFGPFFVLDLKTLWEYSQDGTVNKKTKIWLNIGQIMAIGAGVFFGIAIINL